MYTGHCPDTMINWTPAELNVHQMAALAGNWPVAYEAVQHVCRLTTADNLNMEAGDAFVAPLWTVVRWYLQQPHVDS